MAMFDSELLERFEYYRLAARRAVGRSLVRGPRKRLPGGGTEASGFREYVPGDDYRHVDWIRCARHDELLTRTFAGDEDLHVYILLDCSASMGLGWPSKFNLARRIAAVLGYAALANLDHLSVSAFSGAVVADLPPAHSAVHRHAPPMGGHRARAAGLLRFLEQLSLQGTPTDLARTAEGFVRRYQRHGPAVVISDLYDRGGFQRGLDILQNRGYEPRVVQVYETREAEPGLIGDVELYDVEAETGHMVTVTERAARRYEELFTRFCNSVRSYCTKHGLACLQIASDTPENEVLLAVLGGKR